MSVYVDSLAFGIATDAQAKRVGARNGGQWCHLVADTSAELRAFAQRIGMQPAWIQHPDTEREHFDLTPKRRVAAVRAGAIEIDRRRLVEIIQRKRQQLRAERT